MLGTAVFCEVRYRLDPNRVQEFEEYGRAWVRLIERFGGTHLGFFLPRPAPGDSTISFPGLGAAGADDVAVALYGFPSEKAYNAYRSEVPLDAEAAAVIARFNDPPFKSYERVFLRPLLAE